VQRANILLWSYRTKTLYLLTRWVGPSGLTHPLPYLEGRRGFGLAALRRFGVGLQHTPTPNGSLPGVYGSGGGAERAITLFNPVFAL
jgi:hypothetical protein